MSIFDNEIIAKVDELLHSQGEYLPLELLLAEGRLLYNDYDQWRAGNIDRLDSALFGSSDNLIEQLRSAADYLRALNLQPHTLAYRHWGGGNPLQFSDNSLLNDLFQTAYRKSELEPQFDLFMDNTGNNLANEVITALGDRNYAQAQALSEQLINADPLHTKIDPLLTLIEAAMDQEYTADSSFPQQLHDKIAPLAHEHLGRSADNYLAPLWHRGAKMLAQTPFDPRTPDSHSSLFYGKCGEWEAVIQSVEKAVEWRNQPPLLRRHAIATSKRHQANDTLLDLFRICWAFSDQIDTSVNEIGGTLRQWWRQFLDLDSDLEDQDFPAWLMIERPAQIIGISKKQLIQLNPPSGFLTLYHLIHSEQEQLCPEYRAALKAEHPVLFAYYLHSR